MAKTVQEIEAKYRGKTSALVNTPAQKTPESSVSRAQAIEQKYRGKTITQIPETPVAPVAPLITPDPSGDFVSGIKSGFLSLKQLGAGALAAVGDAIGNEGIRAYGVGKYLEYEEKMKPLSVGRTSKIEDIKGIGSAVDWAQFQAGNLTPSILESVGTAIIGGVIGSSVPAAGTATGAVGGFVAKETVKKYLEKKVVEYVAKGAVKEVAEAQAKRALASTIGAGTAMFANGYIQGLGDVYGETMDDVGKGNAVAGFLGAIPYAAVDTIVDMSILGKVLKGSEGTNALKRYSKAILSSGAKEGAQESLQEADLMIAGLASGKEYSTEEVISRLGNSFASAALAGGSSGIISGRKTSAVPGDAGAVDGTEVPALPAPPTLPALPSPSDQLLIADTSSYIPEQPPMPEAPDQPVMQESLPGIPNPQVEANLNKLGKSQVVIKPNTRINEEELGQLQAEYEGLKHTIDNDPIKKLSKYADHNNTLGEVLGDSNKILTGRNVKERTHWMRFGDDIASELGFEYSEDARKAYDQYVRLKEQLPAIRSAYLGAKEDKNKTYSQEQADKINQLLSDAALYDKSIGELNASVIEKVAEVAINKPVSSKLIDTIRAFSPEESVAFGRKIVDRIAKEVGMDSTVDPLISEAKKYKSADEFVKAHGTPVYHGTTNESAAIINKEGFKPASMTGTNTPKSDAQLFGDVIFFTSNQKRAKAFGDDMARERGISTFGGDSTTVLDSYIQPNAKIARQSDVSGGTLESKNAAEHKAKVLELKEKGFDGLETTPGEFVIWNKDVIKTKSQLTDIWNKAQQKSPQIPEGIKINEMASPTGVPAQITNGIPEIFLPTLVADIKTVANGGKILAHSEIPEFSKVYELKPNESIGDFSARYIREVLIHELAHGKTMTLEDNINGTALNDRIIQARASGKGLQEAQLAYDKHLSMLEQKALEYERTHKLDLTQELESRKAMTAIQKDIKKTIEQPKSEKVEVTKKKLVEIRMKEQVTGSRAGLKAGKEIGKEKVAETKTQYQEMIDTIKDKNASIKSKQNTLTDYAKAFVPAKLRGKFLKRILNATTDKKFSETIEDMNKISDVHNRVVLQLEIVKELKDTVIKSVAGRPKAKFERESQAKLNVIRKNIFGGEFNDIEVKTLSNGRQINKKVNGQLNAEKKIATLISEFQDKNPNDSLPDALIGQIQLLKMVGIKDMTAKELRWVLDNIKSIKETGSTQLELERFNQETERQISRDKVVDIVSGGKELPSSKFVIKTRKEDLTFWEKSIKETDTLLFAWEDVADKISRKDKTSDPYRSHISKIFRKVKNAQGEQFIGEKKQLKVFTEGVKKVYRLKDDKEILKFIEDARKIVDLGKFVNLSGNTEKLLMSRGEAIRYHGWMKDETNDASFDNMGWTDEMKNAVTGLLTENDIAMSDFLVGEFYRDYYDRVNEVFLKDTGTDMPFNETYSPAHRDVESTLPESSLLAKEMMNYATARTGSLIARKENNIALKNSDAFEAAYNHIHKMEHYIAWQLKLNEIRAVFGNKDVRQNISEFYGPHVVKFIDNMLNDLARGGVSDVKIIPWVDNLRTGAAASVLGLSIKVPVKQLVGVANFAMELTTTEMSSGIKDFWKNPINNSKFLFENIPLLAARYEEGFSLIMQETLAKGYDKKIANAKTFNEMLFIFIRNADRFTVVQGAHAAYKAEYKRAYSKALTMEMSYKEAESYAKKEAIEYAEDVIDRTQESSPLYTLSEFQRGGSFARAITMFGSQPTKILRVILNSIANIRAGRGDWKRNYSNLIYAWAIAPFIYNVVANILQPDEFEERVGKTIIRTFLGPLTYIPGMGTVVQAVVDRMMGEKFPFSATPALASVDNLLKAVDKMMLKNPKELDALTYIVDAIGNLKGIPTTVLTKPIREASKK